MYGQMHGHGCCDCTPWESLSKKEKLDILRHKREWLDSKVKMLDKAIKELEKSK